MGTTSKQRLLEQGLALLLRHGYSDLGVAALLDATDLPKGSFYHHFASKEDFGLQVVDLYMKEVHAGLAHCLDDERMPPLQRVRHFFELSAEKYRTQGNLGCLLGGLGQELSGISEVFRGRVEECFRTIEERIAHCLARAVARGDLPRRANPRAMAELLVNCWEGAALRSRLRRDPAPLKEMLDFYFRLVAAQGASTSKKARQPASRRGRLPVRFARLASQGAKT
jgi:TetR/AcrR family transcriptional regulator, transcriptional repressor for nem operon